VATAQVEAFARIDMLYLSLYYFLVVVLLVTLILGVLSSRFSFFGPLPFNNGRGGRVEGGDGGAGWRLCG